MEKSGWIKFLGNNIDKWMKEEIGRGITKFIMINSWIVRQYKNEYNPTHWHNGHISGAGYLKVPKTLGKHYQEKQNRDYRGGNLQLIHGSKMFLSHSTLNIIPEVGDFYFFPNYLMHTVYPFSGTDEERRSISFNALSNFPTCSPASNLIAAAESSPKRLASNIASVPIPPFFKPYCKYF